MNQTFILQPHPHPSRGLAIEAVKTAPNGMAVVIKDVTRTLAENSLLHALIHEIAEKIEWAGKNEMQKHGSDY